jgi:hypothetical protein
MSVRSWRLPLVLALLVSGAWGCGPTGVAGGSDDGPGGPPPDAAVHQWDAPHVWTPDSGGRPPPCDPDDPTRQPQPETCNSVDDDCNGIVDDNVAPRPSPDNPCSIQVCSLGQWRDAPPEFGDEICNGCDDNNDGCTDGILDAAGCTPLKRQDPSTTGGCPMIQKCVGGQWVNDGMSGSTDEICDGIDNDCNGQVDDIPLTPCMAICGGVPNIGFKACENGHEVCRPNGIISIEMCDGLDNDCDGVIDEGVPPQPCPCGDGQKTCQSGHFVGACYGDCELGTKRWCDDPQKCHWGQQTCVTGPDGNTWGDCLEVTERPAGCEGQIMYDANCCDAAGECCQDAFHTWASCGHCATQCNGVAYKPCT